MRKSTTLVITCLVVLGAGLGSALASERIVTPRPATGHDALAELGFRVAPYGNVIQVVPTSRTNIDAAFNILPATCVECGTGCPGGPYGRTRTIIAHLQANQVIPAGYGVSNLVSSNYTVSTVTMSPNGTALGIGDTLDITIVGTVDICTSWFSVWLSVCDVAPASYTDACSESKVVINEVLADPDTTLLLGDANGDGTSSGTDDEFLEIVNVSGGDLDVSGWQIWDAAGATYNPRHTFPSGSVIAAGCVAVVFGGGTPTGSFGGASLVQTASSSQLALNNSTETITIYNASAAVEVTLTWPNWGTNQAYTRDPDITGTTFVQHSTATGSGGALFSPGTKIDGSLFACPDAPRVRNTTPVNGATGVAIAANVSIEFSEPVTVGSGWYGISCTSSGSHTAVETGGPLNFTLNPDADFSYGEICTVTVYAAQVTDQDGGATNMAADYVFSFSIVPDNPPTVQSTTPANLATGVAVDANVSITFSEPVTVDNTPEGDWYDIVCDGGAHTAVTSGGGTTFTLNPDSNFACGETCTVTVYAASVADQDGTATPMAADYLFSFTTVADVAPTVSLTDPASGATNVPVSANISITFSEAVTVDNAPEGDWYDIDCGGDRPAVTSGGPTTYTLNPVSDLPAGTSCTVTVLDTAVTDQDCGTLDEMADPYSFSFTTAAGGGPTTPFFSEYVEGSSNQKALEVFNPSTSALDLSTCQVRMYTNGSPTPSQLYTMSGSLAANDVIVLCHSSAVAPLLAYCDVLTGTTGVNNFNGDDALDLVCSSSTVDVLGQIGSDPGTEWGTGLTSTADNTIRRKCTVTTGDTNGGDAFDPSVQWDGFAQNTFDGLGTRGCK